MPGESALVWSPLVHYLTSKVEGEKQLVFLICPFITLDGIESIIEKCRNTSDLKVITRWNGADLLSGASDTRVFPYLENLDVPLYLHSSIHLKLLIFDNVLAFHTSGNLTRKGLGIASPGNVEIGCEVALKDSDWRMINRLLFESNRVDRSMYETAKQYVEDNPKPVKTSPSLELKPKVDKSFSRLSLPATDDPETLYKYYSSDGHSRFSNDQVVAFVHDLVLYDIGGGLDQFAFFSRLESKFRSQPFTAAIVDLIRAEQSARFGLVNKWITDNCADQPTPYRWEMKSATRRLYNWLEHYYDEITWDIPGEHSMVIYWLKNSS